MDNNSAGNGDLMSCYVLTAGTPVAYVASPPASIGQTLGVGTYVFPVGSQNAPMPSQTALVAIHLQWAAAVAGTITFEVCNFPRYLGGAREGGIDVDDFVATSWQQWNPSSSGSVGGQTTGTGNSITAYTITAGGTNAGTAYVNFPDIGARRIRVKIATTVGGLVRVNGRGKFGD